MSLNPGSKLGHYDVLNAIAAGGMGEVYRARDPRLGRDVAIKSLPEGFATDPERLARFEREARLLASLNHPNIAGIHGIEEVEQRRYLVLEFVDGETLASRLARGMLPVDEAIEICRDIAAGVEAAHESGVVHRDLKPANVILTPDGRVKVLDFGLATTDRSAGSGSHPDLTHSPTLARATTRDGVILGTAAYMSPEQARGRVLDKRTDIWSFGCVLFECLTGRPLFQGETVSDLIARILEREPEWGALPEQTPARVRDLLRRCLRKDPKERLRDIGDARLELTEALAPGAAPGAAASAPEKPRWGWLPWGVAIGMAVVMSVLVLTRPASDPSAGAEPPMRLSVPLPAGLEVSPEAPDVTVSPDGRTILFVASDDEGTPRLYVRPLQSTLVRALPGTDGAALPFWAPDSRRIGFFADGNLLRTTWDEADRAQIICPAPSPRGGAWSPRDVIVFAPGASGPLMKVPASGGSPTPVTTLDAERGENAHRFPQFLPDGERFLYAALPARDGKLATRVGALDGSAGPVLVTSRNAASYAAGYLLYDQNQSIVAQAFDPATLTLGGAPRVVRDLYNVSANYSGSPVLMTAEDGTLIQSEFRTSGTRLVLMDREGKVRRQLNLPEGRYFWPTFAPDGTRLVVSYSRIDEMVTKLWLIDLSRDLATRFAFGDGFDGQPRWTRDGRRVVWGMDGDTGRELYWKNGDGSGEQELLADVPNLFNDPTSVTDDAVVYRSLSGQTNEDIWMVPLTGDRKPRPLIQTPFNELDAAVSPDGKWMAYRSDESGDFEVYVVAYPALDRKVRVSTDGAARLARAGLSIVQWRADGRELYFAGGDGRTLMSVPVETGAEFRAGTPAAMLRLERDTTSADISPDGQMVVASVPADQQTRSVLNLVFHWVSEVGGGPQGR